MSREEYNRKLGEWIRTERTKLGISREALAVAIGVSSSSIFSWEAGRGTMLAYSRSLIGKYFKAEAKRLSKQLGAMPESDDAVARPPRSAAAGGRHA